MFQIWRLSRQEIAFLLIFKIQVLHLVIQVTRENKIIWIFLQQIKTHKNHVFENFSQNNKTKMETEKFESVLYCPHEFEMVILNQNLLEMWTRITPNTDTFYAVRLMHCERRVV